MFMLIVPNILKCGFDKILIYSRSNLYSKKKGKTVEFSHTQYSGP